MSTNRFCNVYLAAAFATAIGASLAAEPPATQPASSNAERALKLADADLEALKKLDYQSVDLKTVDLPTKTAAAMALNNLLAAHGERARNRVVLLEDYIAAKGLTDELNQDSSPVPATEPRPLEDGLKLAVLVVQSPEGQQAYVSQLTGTKPDALQRVHASYYALCQKEWGEVVYRRFRVQELASFLDRKGLLNDFISWSRDEVGRRKQERDAANAQIRSERKAEEEKARAQRLQKYKEKQDREHELMLKRLEYAYDRDNDRDYNYNWR